MFGWSFPHDVTITFYGRKSKYTFIKHILTYNDSYWLELCAQHLTNFNVAFKSLSIFLTSVQETSI